MEGVLARARRAKLKLGPTQINAWNQHTLSGAYCTLTGRPRISRESKCLRAVSASSRVTYSKILLTSSVIHAHGLSEQSCSPGTWVVPIDIRKIDLHTPGHVSTPILEILQNSHPQLTPPKHPVMSTRAKTMAFCPHRKVKSAYIRPSLVRTAAVRSCTAWVWYHTLRSHTYRLGCIRQGLVLGVSCRPARGALDDPGGDSTQPDLHLP